MKSNLSKIISNILEIGFQIHPAAIQILQNENNEINLEKIIKEIIDNKIKTNLKDKTISKIDVDNLLNSIYIKEKNSVKESQELKVEAVVKFDVSEKIESTKEIKGELMFQSLFRSRFQKLLSIASKRPGYNNLESLAGVSKHNKGSYRTSGLVLEKRITPNAVQFVIDDFTGRIPIVALNENVKNVANKILSDQMVLVKLKVRNRGASIIEEIHSPDIPDRSPTLASKRVYALLLSDLHLGSNTFLEDAIMKLISWLNKGDKDDYVSSRIRYLVIAGDGIDGVGVYPGLENDLIINNVEDQYSRLASLLQQIPNHIKIFLAPGNHDSVRQAHPQPKISRKYAEQLYNLENVTMISNPAILEFHRVKLLIFHGRSLDDVISSTPGLSVLRPAVAMKFLLKARHLVPIYGGRTQLSPETEDLLTIDEVPDIFHSGHLHVLDSERYRGTLLINSGTWQSQTSFQANMGIVPNPGIAPIVDLSTLEMLSKSFL